MNDDLQMELYEGLNFASLDEIEDFKKQIYNVDEIFKFLSFRSCVDSKYMNIIFSLDNWGRILSDYKSDFTIPLYFYWHYQNEYARLPRKNVFVDEWQGAIVKKLEEVFARQVYVAFLSMVDKLKHAYSNIYNFSNESFKYDKSFVLQDEIVKEAQVEEELLSNLSKFKNFIYSDEVKRIRKLRNSGVHDIGGKNQSFILFAAQNNNDIFRNLEVPKEHITDKNLLNLLKIILKKLDDMCMDFNTVNLHYYRYLIQVKSNWEMSPIE